MLQSVFVQCYTLITYDRDGDKLLSSDWPRLAVSQVRSSPMVDHVLGIEAAISEASNRGFGISTQLRSVVEAQLDGGRPVLLTKRISLGKLTQTCGLLITPAEVFENMPPDIPRLMSLETKTVIS